jgi:crotonobetainyl-CoA:carnitine CoA-transferase CaiB-like acyl-CoA transferase
MEKPMQRSEASVQTTLLKGIRVVDCSQFIPGPYATLLVADLGAEVIKVEPPGGDPMRYLGALEGDGWTAAYKLINRNKTVIELDLKTFAGAQLFKDLLRRADILFESYRPGAFARLGFGSEDLKALNPKLIHVALTGYGQTGAYRQRAGHDLNYVALAGVLGQSGLAELPIQSMPPTADFGGGLHAAFMMSAALFARERTGIGLSIDLSMSDTILAWQSLYLTEAARTVCGIKRGTALLNGGAAFYQIYRTKDDRFVTLGALEPKFWSNFCQAVGKPDWVIRQVEPFPQSALTKEVAALFLSEDLAQWCKRLESVDCCFERVHELNDLPNNVQIRDRQMIDSFGDEKPVVEVLFPAWIEGQPPAKRVPVHFSSAEEVIGKWTA